MDTFRKKISDHLDHIYNQSSQELDDLSFNIDSDVIFRLAHGEIALLIGNKSWGMRNVLASAVDATCLTKKIPFAIIDWNLNSFHFFGEIHKLKTGLSLSFSEELSEAAVSTLEEVLSAIDSKNLIISEEVICSGTMNLAT